MTEILGRRIKRAGESMCSLFWKYGGRKFREWDADASQREEPEMRNIAPVLKREQSGVS